MSTDIVRTPYIKKISSPLMTYFFRLFRLKEERVEAIRGMSLVIRPEYC